jgi:hypothetical protein
MFTTHPNDLTKTLAEMERVSRDRCNYNQVEAKAKFKEFLALDRRFDQFDKNALVERVTHCRTSGAHLDLIDPQLKGLPPRPLDRRW